MTEYLIPVPHRDMMPPHSFIKSEKMLQSAKGDMILDE